MCVYDLAVLVVRKANGAVVAPIPAFIRHNCLHAAVGAGELQLRQQLCLGAVLIFQPPRAAGAAIPAVGKPHRQGVFAAFQQVCHIIGLILHTLAVVRDAGGEDKITHPLLVQPRFIQAAGGDVQPRFFYIGRVKTLAEAVHGIALLFVYMVIACNPLRLPRIDAGLKGGLCPIAGSILLIPEAHPPEHLCFCRDS